MKFNLSRPWTLLMMFCFAASISTVPSLAQTQSADNLRLKLAAKYENMRSMSATFVQVATSEYLESPERYTGTLLFSGPKYRIQTGSQSIVTDGATLWIHNQREKQVIINDLVDDASSFSLTTFLKQFDKEYNAVLGESVIRQGLAHDVLELSPIAGYSQFRTVRMEVRRSDTVVTHLEVVDLNEVHMTIDLSEIVINPPVSANSFTLSIPPGVEVVDLRN